MGLIQRHITEEFINHIHYGDYMLGDNAIFKGEKMDDTLVFLYVREMSRYYESENISDAVKKRTLHGDVFVMWINYKHLSNEDEKHYIALGLKKLVCVAADYGIKISNGELAWLKDIEITGEGNLYDLISDYYRQIDPHCVETPKGVQLPAWKDADDKIKALFIYPENFNNFLNGCFLPNGEIKDIRYIVDAYNKHRDQKPETIQKGVPTLLYEFLRDNGIIIVPEDKPKSKLRSFQREFKKLKV